MDHSFLGNLLEWITALASFDTWTIMGLEEKKLCKHNTICIFEKTAYARADMGKSDARELN